jgi:hypothetical protein
MVKYQPHHCQSIYMSLIVNTSSSITLMIFTFIGAVLIVMVTSVIFVDSVTATEQHLANFVNAMIQIIHVLVDVIWIYAQDLVIYRIDIIDSISRDGPGTPICMYAVRYTWTS